MFSFAVSAKWFVDADSGNKEEMGKDVFFSQEMSKCAPHSLVLGHPKEGKNRAFSLRRLQPVFLR